MHEATFRLEPAGPYGESTAGTDTTVALWCNDHADLLSIRGDASAVLAAVDERVGVSDRIDRGDRTLAVTADCLGEEGGTVDRSLRRHGCLLVPPLRYERGTKLVRVLALDPGDLTALYRDLVDESSVTVEAKRSFDQPDAGEDRGQSPFDAAPTLSPRQREALTIAHERGYYERPREVTAEAIGEDLDVTRRTAAEHLRRAEQKVIDAYVERSAHR
ncbi:DNA binding protein [Halovivax asiaticus JCM 14624]|uniref:DNA binding protein n=1 Tax=Halovivax asiaticus JCM 14624 TaxID=1227490 RepID=M0BPB0_9EURY|nr:helix-turn-helix domain-containing protein [Halovivax asiaticus]ELZ12721.1 DNA binding protein [Halovivax asiaticus JCM 14624]